MRGSLSLDRANAKRVITLFGVDHHRPTRAVPIPIDQGPSQQHVLALHGIADRHDHAAIGQSERLACWKLVT